MSDSEQQVETIIDLLNEKNPLLCLIGETDSGKTRVLTALKEKLEDSHEIIHLHAHENLQPADLVDKLCQHCTMHLHSKFNRLERQLHEVLVSLTEHHKTCVLIIDDAHTLNYSILAALTHLAIEQENMQINLYTVLSGHIELKDKLSSLTARPFPEIKLGALSREDSLAQITELLKQAAVDVKQYTTATFEEIYRQTGGMPEAIRQSVQAMITHSQQDNTREAAISNAKPSARATTWNDYWQTHRLQIISIAGLCLTAVATLLWQHRPTAVVLNPQKSARLALKETPIQQPSVQLATKKKNTTYTIQLFASNMSQPHFNNDHHLKLRTLHLQKNKKDWYVTLYGNYKTYDDAKNALTQLPDNIKALHPWIRSIQSLESLS